MVDVDVDEPDVTDRAGNVNVLNVVLAANDDLVLASAAVAVAVVIVEVENADTHKKQGAAAAVARRPT